MLCTAPIQTMTIKASMIAYSTAVGPSSDTRKFLTLFTNLVMVSLSAIVIAAIPHQRRRQLIEMERLSKCRYTASQTNVPAPQSDLVLSVGQFFVADTVNLVQELEAANFFSSEISEISGTVKNGSILGAFPAGICKIQRDVAADRISQFEKDCLRQVVTVLSESRLQRSTITLVGLPAGVGFADSNVGTTAPGASNAGSSMGTLVLPHGPAANG
jgi:hypothetical protein